MSLLTMSKTNEQTNQQTNKKTSNEDRIRSTTFQLKSRQKHSTAILVIFFKMQVKLTEVNKSFIHHRWMIGVIFVYRLHFKIV